MAAVREESAHGSADESGIRLRVLAEVSHAFASVVTDYGQLLATIARMAADLVGDGCLVTLIADDDDDLLVSAANAHSDPVLDEAYRTYHRDLGISKSKTAVAAVVIRTGEPKLVSEIDPAVVLAHTDAELKPLVERLNVHSFVVVPIRSRDVVIGSLSMFRSGPGRGYRGADLTLLQDVADRAGLAIENARLYDNLERRVRQRTAELEGTVAELEAFSYSVAHDLRAPLRSIHGFSQAVLEDCGDQLDAQGKKNLTRVCDAATHMGVLIDDLLELSRVTKGALRREPVDVTALATAVATRLREAQPDRGVEIAIAPQLVANVDPRLVEIVLTNLLGNAWKFTSRRAHAKIELGVVPATRPPVFFVKDDGAGFDPAHAGRLFGVFQRLHGRDDFEGTGVGLATVQRIVRRHGGRIWAEGAVDGGATFSFTLAADD